MTSKYAPNKTRREHIAYVKEMQAISDAYMYMAQEGYAKALIVEAAKRQAEIEEVELDADIEAMERELARYDRYLKQFDALKH